MFKPIQYQMNPLSFPVDPTEDFEAGVVLQLDPTTGQLIRSDGTAPLGLADGYKSDSYHRKVINEHVVLTAEDAIPLAHANLTADAVKVTDVTGVTEYLENTDYLVNDINGTIARLAGQAIGDGDEVLVSSEYLLTVAEWRASCPIGNDDTIGSGQCAVWTDGVFETDQYVLTDAFAINQHLYAEDGLLTNSYGQSGSPLHVGRVLRVPAGGLGSAALPYPALMLVEFDVDLY